jgi:hypothetical protein
MFTNHAKADRIWPHVRLIVDAYRLARGVPVCDTGPDFIGHRRAVLHCQRVARMVTIFLPATARHRYTAAVDMRCAMLELTKEAFALFRPSTENCIAAMASSRTTKLVLHSQTVAIFEH